MKILYAQCWEDPRVLQDALAINSDDDILSIASGGDNTLALLLGNPRSIVAVDRNPAQIYLVELKIAAIRNLNHDRFIGFIGASVNKYRSKTYNELRSHLTPNARRYWDNHIRAIDRGIIHCGKFENYLSIFNSLVLPLIHSRRRVRRFLACRNENIQKIFYHQYWNTPSWRYLFRIFFSRFLLSRIGRTSDFFRYVDINDVSTVLFKRTERGLTEIPIKSNFYVEYILSGAYRDVKSAPPYLNPDSFEIIKKRLNRVKLVCQDLEEYISRAPEYSISKFNLSDVFEYLSPRRTEDLLEQIVRISRPGGRLAFWTLFVPQSIPDALKKRISDLEELSENLSSAARTFFYQNFCLWQIDGK